MKQQPSLSTHRLFLRPFESSDAADVQRLAGDRAIAEMTLEIPHPYEVEMAERWISTLQGRFESGEEVVFAVTIRESARLAGAVGLELTPRFDRAELGYWIAKDNWGRGYATEAAEAVLSYGFTTRGLHRIHATPFKRNPASVRVLQKLGMKHEGQAREHVKKWGVFEDLGAVRNPLRLMARKESQLGGDSRTSIPRKRESRNQSRGISPKPVSRE